MRSGQDTLPCLRGGCASTKRRLRLAPAVAASATLLGGCAAVDEQIALTAKAELVGMSALDVQTCLGLPDQRLGAGKTTLLTYFANSTRTFSLSPGLASLSMGGYCHTTVRIEDDRVARVEFSGDTTSLLSRDAACAPIVKTCLRPDLRRPTASP